jgi:hypothetical protein
MHFTCINVIFSFVLVTGKYAMGSSEPLCTTAATPSPEDVETQEYDTIILDGAPK